MFNHFNLDFWIAVMMIQVKFYLLDDNNVMSSYSIQIYTHDLETRKLLYKKSNNKKDEWLWWKKIWLYIEYLKLKNLKILSLNLFDFKT